MLYERLTCTWDFRMNNGERASTVRCGHLGRVVLVAVQKRPLISPVFH